MKKLLNILMSALILMMALSNSIAQDTDSELKKFGLGIHVEQFRLQDLMADNFVPVNKLIFTISPGSNFRIEPSIGYSRSKSESTYDGYSYSSVQSGFFFGIGIFGMYQAGPTNFYFGIRTEQGTINEESKYSGPGYSDSDTGKYRRFMFGPAIGAEFFFAKNFSFGGEFGLKNYSMKDKSEDAPSTADDSKNKFFTTETGLLLRFYF